jgi:hypothetical protein
MHLTIAEQEGAVRNDAGSLNAQAKACSRCRRNPSHQKRLPRRGSRMDKRGIFLRSRRADSLAGLESRCIPVRRWRKTRGAARACGREACFHFCCNRRRRRPSGGSSSTQLCADRRHDPAIKLGELGTSDPFIQTDASATPNAGHDPVPPRDLDLYRTSGRTRTAEPMLRLAEPLSSVRSTAMSRDTRPSRRGKPTLLAIVRS